MLGLFEKKSKPQEKQIGALTDAELKTIDTVILVDHSGSMGTASLRVGGSRLDEVQAQVFNTAQIAEQFDDDGLTVIPFSSEAQVFDHVGSLKVASVFKSFRPDYSTNLTEALNRAIHKAHSSKKNTVVIVYTDGRPDNMVSAKAVITHAGQELGRPKIGFTFVQVGDDRGAAAFLDDLDNSMPVDVVATVRAADAEKLSYSQLAWLAQNA